MQRYSPAFRYWHEADRMVIQPYLAEESGGTYYLAVQVDAAITQLVTERDTALIAHSKLAVRVDELKSELAVEIVNSSLKDLQIQEFKIQLQDWLEANGPGGWIDYLRKRVEELAQDNARWISARDVWTAEMKAKDERIKELESDIYELKLCVLYG